MKFKHLLALAAFAVGGSSAWAALEVDPKFEISKDANALDGVTCVITDASNAKVFSTNMPGKSSWDVQGLDLANWGEKDTHKYIRFSKPSGYTQPAEGNVYYLYFVDANGVKHPSWGPKDSPLNQTGGTALFLGLDDSHLSKYGQDRDNGALWKVVKEGEGYTLQNVATNQYATPANNDVQNDKQYVKLYMGLSDGYPIDMTAQISNASFNTGNTSGWTATGVGYHASGDFDGKFAESWQPDGNKSIEQTVSNLPAGLYKVTCTSVARGVASAELYANSNTAPMLITEAVNNYEVFEKLNEAGSITLGARVTGTGAGASWFAVDAFTLTYVGEDFDEVELTTGLLDRKELETAQTTAKETFDANKTVANYQALVAAAAATKAEKDYEDGQVALTQAALTNGAIATDQMDGWRCTNIQAFHVNTWSNEGATDGSNMVTPFIENWTAAGGILGDGTISYLMVGLNPGDKYAFRALGRAIIENDKDAILTGITMFANEAEIDLTTQGTATNDGKNSLVYGTFTLTGTVDANGCLLVGFKIQDTNCNWLSFKNVSFGVEQDVYMAINSEAKYGTFCAPFDVELPDGVTAYTASINNQTGFVHLEAVDGTTLAANTPVIVYKEDGLASTMLTGIPVAGTPEQGCLTGVYELTAVSEGDYLLQNNTAGVGFYQVDVNNAHIGANRCYIKASAVPAGVKALVFDNDADAIQNIEVAGESKAIYDLMGRKVNNATKGIYIINGKKVLK